VAWTRMVAPEKAGAELEPLYARMRARSSRGQVSNLWQACAPDPAGLATLSAAQAEAIALVVSATNGCAYCVAHHGPRYAKACGDEPLARAVALDYREANLPARDRVLLDCAVALTCEPAERKQEDVERLREYGFDDLAILKATEIAALYNLINRIVCALGIELEPGLAAWEFRAQR